MGMQMQAGVVWIVAMTFQVRADVGTDVWPNMIQYTNLRKSMGGMSDADAAAAFDNLLAHPDCQT